MSIRFSRLFTAHHTFSFAFRKWKSARVRHVEELSLMESYQDVKREGLSTQNTRARLFKLSSSQKTSVVCSTAGSRLLDPLVIAA